ncbi:MAG: ribonucleotide reductase, partial [Alteromonadaceae bacterium]|nr:ribonucleotide reductase [Alteromonadaceae bacterium]
CALSGAASSHRLSPLSPLERRWPLRGTGELHNYMRRDEAMPFSSGLKVVNQIMENETIPLAPSAGRDMWDESEAAETAYANYILRDPILGYSAEYHSEQFRFVANRRARTVGLEEPFPGAKNVSPWLDEQATLRKEKNFFETRVIEYQTGTQLEW